MCKRLELLPAAYDATSAASRPQHVKREDWERWAARCLVRGLFADVATRVANDDTDAAAAAGGSGGAPAWHYRTLATAQQVAIHPASVLQARRPECVLFTELVKTTSTYMRGVIEIDFTWLTELVPSKRRAQHFHLI